MFANLFGCGGPSVHVPDGVAGHCAILYFAILFIGKLVGWIITCQVPCHHQALVQNAVSSFVASGFVYVHGIVCTVYGIYTYLFVMVALSIVERHCVPGTANPLLHVIKLLAACDQNSRHMSCWHVATNLIGGLVAFPVVAVLWTELSHSWRYDVTHLHCMAPTMFGQCPSPTELWPLVVEFAGSYVMCLVFVTSTFSPWLDPYERLAKVVITIVSMLLGANSVAIQLNPALAGSMTFMCWQFGDGWKVVAFRVWMPILGAFAYVFSLGGCHYPTAPVIAPPQPRINPCCGQDPCCCQVLPCGCRPPCTCIRRPCGCIPPCDCRLPCGCVPPTCCCRQRHRSQSRGRHDSGDARSHLQHRSSSQHHHRKHSASSCCRQRLGCDPCPPVAACCPPAPAPCQPSLMRIPLKAQLTQLKTDDHRELDYKILIPPVCAERGVRFCHKFVIDKEKDKSPAEPDGPLPPSPQLSQSRPPPPQLSQTLPPPPQLSQSRPPPQNEPEPPQGNSGSRKSGLPST